MPLGSRLLAAKTPEAAWTVTEHKLHLIASILCRKVLPYPWERSDVEFEAVDVDELDRWRSERLLEKR